MLMRTLNWPDCYNVRDLGGLPTSDGRTTKFGAVVRSDILSRLTNEGRQALWDYGIRTIIDLREPNQIAEEEAFPFGQAPTDLTILNWPLESRKPEVSALFEHVKDRGDVYCIILDHYPDLITDAVRAIANAQPGGVVIHCHGGKDRTGTITALLLNLVSVSDELIADDYAQSQEQLWPLWEQIIEEVGGEENADFFLKPTATVDMMLKTLNHLQKNHGGAEAYLLRHGLSAEEISHLCQRLLSE